MQYDGEWKNDKKHGQGTKYFANNDRYEGQWNENKRHGKGTHTYANGDMYENLKRKKSKT